MSAGWAKAAVDKKGWNKVMGSLNKGWTHLQQEPKTSEVVSRAIPDSTPR